jgi:hypothetical protein
MLLSEIAVRYRPESWNGQRGDTWPEHARYLWRNEPGYMACLTWYMIRRDSWFYKPVITDGDVVQDAHHRIVIALALGWGDRDIPWRQNGS